MERNDGGPQGRETPVASPRMAQQAPRMAERHPRGVKRPAKARTTTIPP